jgi:hypothetical protein
MMLPKHCLDLILHNPQLVKTSIQHKSLTSLKWQITNISPTKCTASQFTPPPPAPPPPTTTTAAAALAAAAATTTTTTTITYYFFLHVAAFVVCCQGELNAVTANKRQYCTFYWWCIQVLYVSFPLH